MSLAVNNTQLQDLEPDHPFLKVLEKCTKWIKDELPDPVEFDFPPEMIVPATGEPGSRETYPPTVGDVPMHVYTIEENSWEIRYFTGSSVKDGAMVFTKPTRIELGRRAVSKIKNADLIFWLIFVNPYFDAKDVPTEMQKYVNLERKPERHFVLVDLKKDAAKLIEQERLLTKAKDFLFGDKALKGSKLDNIAAMFDVANIANKPTEIILSDLNKILFKTDSKGRYDTDALKQFIKTAEGEGKAVEVVLEFGKLASTLLEKGILKKFKPEPEQGITKHCVYLMDGNERSEHIVDLVPGVKHIQQISEALAAKDELHATLEKMASK